MSDAWQVLWWCRHLSLTKSQLEATIQTVGNKVVDIEQYLLNNQVGKGQAQMTKSPVPVVQKRYLH